MTTGLHQPLRTTRLHKLVEVSNSVENQPDYNHFYETNAQAFVVIV